MIFCSSKLLIFVLLETFSQWIQCSRLIHFSDLSYANNLPSFAYVMCVFQWRTLSKEDKEKYEERAKRIAEDMAAKQQEADRAFNDSLNRSQSPWSDVGHSSPSASSAGRPNTPGRCPLVQGCVYSVTCNIFFLISYLWITGPHFCVACGGSFLYLDWTVFIYRF